MAVRGAHQERALALARRERSPLLEGAKEYRRFPDDIRLLEFLLLGDEAGVRRVLANGRAWDAKNRSPLMPGYWDAAEALLAGDAARFAAGIATYLEKHWAQARVHNSQISNSPFALVCFPATELAIVAAWRGLRLPPDLPGRRRAIPLRVYALREFDGKPIPPPPDYTRFTWEVDLIPPGLLPG